ncbi:hypothetical protein A8924_5181 [Saccharopolyspora erythraea NRRL 2338]|uniref:Secreted protein n=1 Tax=Saccharopolyspora erythraea TaxID=1836 RepID=A0ABP3NEW6_SACER|nr:hypothetical protein A8924_5181 [Saccharopolyspora erythraea NRRL 2338]
MRRALTATLLGGLVAVGVLTAPNTAAALTDKECVEAGGKPSSRKSGVGSVLQVSLQVCEGGRYDGGRIDGLREEPQNSGRPEESQNSGQHEEPQASGQHEEPQDSGQHEDSQDSGRHEEHRGS